MTALPPPAEYGSDEGPADQAHLVARALVRAGIGAGNRIALLAPGPFDTRELRHAAELVGAAFVVCRTTESPERLAEFVIQTGADTVLVFPQFADRAWIAMRSPQVRRVLGYGPVPGADVDLLASIARG